MAVPTPMGMTSHAVGDGGNHISSASNNNNNHQNQTMTNNNIDDAVPMHHTAGNGTTPSTIAAAAATSAYNYNSVYQQPPQNGQNYSTGMMGATNFSTNSVNNEYGNSNDADALRRQIQELQSQLTQKDDVIFELEASAATSHAESKHCTESAERKVHLVEEELRRTRQEANSYKSSFLRQKKRVAELESQKNRSGSGGNREHHNRHNGGGASGGNYHGGNVIENSKLAASLSTWGEHGLHQPSGPSIQQHDHHSPVEMRKVTPSISNEEQQPHETTNQNLTMADDTHHNDSMFDDRPLSGSKRKTLKQLANDIVDGTDVVGKHMQQPVNSGNTNVREDSVRQRMAKHLLNREEMGCYSLHMGGYTARACDISSSRMTEESTQHEGKEEEKEEMASVVLQRFNDKALQQDTRKEQETQTFVKSILYQMVDAPEHTITVIPAQGNLSVSGLVNVLLVRFNSLFHRKSAEDDTTNLDKDGDHVMENATNHNTSDTCNIEYQRMALTIESNQSSSGLDTYTTVSWRAGLYLLRVIHDILLLSGNARDDLRWWLYQARQSSGGVDGSSSSNNTRSPSSAQVSGGGDKGDIRTGSHSRIEGLPSKHTGQSSTDRKEVLWTRNCLQSSLAQSLPWDPMTMAQPCSIFFELLVGLMKGNVFEQSKSSTCDNELEQTLVQLVQLKSIDLVLALMLDAAPHDHAKDCQGNRTPYLWKFWLDALIPGTLTPSSDAVAIGDFLSPWEKIDGSSTDTLLGSGRKHSTRLLAEDSSSNSNQQQNKKGAEKQGRSVKGGSRSNPAADSAKESSKAVECPKPRGQLPDLIKGRILQLLSHFVLSSSSVYQSLYEIVDEETKLSLGKRILAAVLDHLEESLVPYLSSSSIEGTTQTAEQCLQLCSTCIQFLLIMSRSNEGIRMLRLQMRLESKQDETSRWSKSAIGCVTSVLDGIISFAASVEEKKGDVSTTSHSITQTSPTW